MFFVLISLNNFNVLPSLPRNILSGRKGKYTSSEEIINLEIELMRSSVRKTQITIIDGGLL
jgi:hypothetical protein